MGTSKLTKQGIGRLSDAPAVAKLMNGCYNVVTAKAVFSRYTLELKVEVTHPALVWQSGDRNGASLTYWEGCMGHLVKIPKELEEKVKAMRILGTMGDNEAAALSKENTECFLKLCEDLGFTQ
jgi:hypothetical protein